MAGVLIQPIGSPFPRRPLSERTGDDVSEEDDLEAKPWAEPKSLSFADVNDFVFEVERHFEELQGLCLTLAGALDKRPGWRSPPTWTGERWSEPWPDIYVAEWNDDTFSIRTTPYPPGKNLTRLRLVCILSLTESRS